MAPACDNDPDFPPFSSMPISPLDRRAILLRDCNVVLDVGANTGQYATWLRSLGYAGRIVSFEPLPDEFSTLSELASADPLWECHNVALGAWEGVATLHVAQNSIGSSLYQPTRDYVQRVPNAAAVGEESVKLSTLATAWPELNCAEQRVYLKVHVEGGELPVLAGAAKVLDEIALIELKIALVPTYQAAPLFSDLMPYLAQKGYQIVALEQNYKDDEATGQMMTIDGLFARWPGLGQP